MLTRVQQIIRKLVKKLIFFKQDSNKNCVFLNSFVAKKLGFQIFRPKISIKLSIKVFILILYILFFMLFLIVYEQRVFTDILNIHVFYILLRYKGN